MYCRFCGKEIPADSQVCQHCGKELVAKEVPAPAPKAKMPTSRLVIILVAAVVCIALVAAIVVIGIQAGGSNNPTEPPATVPTDGNPEDVTCKGTYTAQGDTLLSAMDTAVATLDDYTLTNADVQIYYWMQFYQFYEDYAYYASALGLDVNKALDTQHSAFAVGDKSTTVTWQQYFLSCALEAWRRNQTLAHLAAQANFQMPDYYLEALEGIEGELLTNAQSVGLSSAEALIQNDMGPGATMEAYKKYLETYYLGYAYFAQEVDKLEVSEGEVNAYFAENEEALKEDGITKEDKTYLVDVRHILIQPEGDGTTFTDAQWEACLQKAQNLLEQWKRGEATEESFAALAGEHTQDGGSKYTGGLYENVATGETVEEFNDWIFAEGRKTGDVELVKTEHGYHIMYFVTTTPVWYATCENTLLSEKSDALLQQLLEETVLDVSYENILLGLSNLE